MKVESRDIHILRLAGDIKQLQYANTFSDLIGTNAPSLPGKMQVCEALVPDPADHVL